MSTDTHQTMHEYWAKEFTRRADLKRTLPDPKAEAYWRARAEREMRWNDGASTKRMGG